MSYHTLGFPVCGMTNASKFKWGFTSDSNPKRGNTKMGNKIDINLWESAEAKTQCHSLPYSVLRIRNDQCKHFKFGFTPDSNPKMGKKEVTKLLFVYVKEPRLKSLTWRTLGFSEYGLTNSSIVSLALPLTATQKGVIKWGNKIDMHLCKKTMLKPVPYLTFGFPSTEWPTKAILGLPLPLSVLPKWVKRGNKSYICLCKTCQGPHRCHIAPLCSPSTE